MTSTVSVDVPGSLDATRTQQWLQSIVSQRDTVARLRVKLSGEQHPPGPGVLTQIGRLEAAWREIERRFGLLTAEDLVRLAGAGPTSVRNWIHNQRRRHGVLAVRRGGRNLFPGFQFTDSGRVQPWLKQATEPLLAAGWSEESVLLWLASPTGLLSGEVPVDVVGEQRDRVHAAVVAAATGAAW